MNDATSVCSSRIGAPRRRRFEVTSESSGTESEPDAPDALGRIFAMASTCPDIESSNGTSSMFLCTEVDASGNFIGQAIVSSDTVAHHTHERVEPGMYITNSYASGLSHPLDVEPVFAGGLWEVKDESLQHIELSKEYQSYLLIMHRNRDNPFVEIAKHVKQIATQLRWLDFGVNQPRGHKRLLMDLMRVSVLEPCKVHPTTCGGCRTHRRCTFKLGDLYLGSECASRLELAMPAIEATETLATKIATPFEYAFTLEDMND